MAGINYINEEEYSRPLKAKKMEAEIQKAIELVEKFNIFLGTTEDCEEVYLDELDKKYCAIKCCELMLEEYPSQAPKGSHELERHIYWQKVLTHIKEM